MKVLERLYDAEQDGLLRLAVLLLGSRAEAEEVVQDAFLAVSGRVDELERPGAYLRTSVVNRCRSLLRRRRTVENHRAEVESRYGQPNGTTDLELPAHLGELAQALRTLNERQRTVIVLRYFLDLPDAEIAEMLDMALPTVRTVARRSLALLRDQLVAENREEQP